MEGYLHTIIGPMFSGKTSFLLHEMERLARAGKRVILFTGDNREDTPVIHSRRPIYKDIKIHKTRCASAMMEVAREYDVVGVDEVQFCEENLHVALSSLAREGKIVLASGLDQDYRKEPFMTTLRLIPESEKVTRLTSVCQKCGSLNAIRNIRKVSSNERVLEGAEDLYEVRCRTCGQH